MTALPFRPDTATLSNNGNSMHAPICMDNWSALPLAAWESRCLLPAHALLAQSIERWLDGGQGYASGPSARTGGSYEDEYLMTPVACLLGIAEMLGASRDAAWLAARAADLRREIDAMRARDVDGDGLIESRIRLGQERRSPVEHELVRRALVRMEGRLHERAALPRAAPPVRSSSPTSDSPAWRGLDDGPPAVAAYAPRSTTRPRAGTPGGGAPTTVSTTRPS